LLEEVVVEDLADIIIHLQILGLVVEVAVREEAPAVLHRF
jgi:hypothetical protein